jgi:hypothetical protein
MSYEPTIKRLWINFPGLPGTSNEQADYEVGRKLADCTIDSIIHTMSGHYDIYVCNKEGYRYMAWRIYGCDTIEGYDDPNAQTKLPPE